MFHGSKIAEMKRSDPYDFVESKKFEIGSVENVFELLKDARFRENPGNPWIFVIDFQGFGPKKCPGHPKF